MNGHVTGLRQVAVVLHDVQAGARFYRDVLGLTFLFSPHESLAFLEAGTTRLMLTTPQGAGAPGQNSILYFQVDDVSEAFDAAVARGAERVRDPELTARMEDHELWIGFIHDPEGNLIGLLEERR